MSQRGLPVPCHTWQMNPPERGGASAPNTEDDEDQGNEHLAYALQARAPEMPPTGHQQPTTGTSSTLRI
jgi:hypothetical protein